MGLVDEWAVQMKERVDEMQKEKLKARGPWQRDLAMISSFPATKFRAAFGEKLPKNFGRRGSMYRVNIRK